MTRGARSAQCPNSYISNTWLALSTASTSLSRTTVSHIPLRTLDMAEQILALLCCRGRRRDRAAESLSNLSLPRMTSPASLSRAAMSPIALTTEDVVEQILGFISPFEFATLYACALVCSSWRRPSQRRLFNKVELWNIPAREWERLLHCLETSPHLRSYIRDLMVLSRMRLPANLGQLFHRVSTLNVHMTDEMHLTLILALPALEHLTCIGYSTLLPRVFSRSDTICVYNGVLRPAAPKLRHLMVSGRSDMFQEHMLSWIESTGIASDLESASLEWHYQGDRHLAAFLHGRRPAFRRLHLDLNWDTEKAPNLGDVANIEELRVTVETPQSAPPFPAILAFLSTTRFPSLRMLEMEIRPTWPVASLPDRYLPLPHDLVDRLHHVRLVFGRGYDTIQDIEMERMLSVFRREGQPDIVEVDLGTAALTAGPTQGACHCIIIPPPCLGMRNWH